jgi:phosphohistidine phosphatase SixA/ketosteroid isomerase-like protein
MRLVRWSVPLALLVLWVGVLPTALRGEEDAAAAIARTLDAFHEAAARADGERYFALLTSDAVFLGTDATERWTKPEFEAFARSYFEKGRGWSYRSTVRRVVVDASGRHATFDELLENEHYGTCRGSGCLRREGEGWRIALYDLSIPMPNDLARDFVERIRAHAAGRSPETTVYLVRHAEKETDGEDPGLTEAGRARAAALPRVLRSADLRAVYATPLRRSALTASPVAEGLGIPVTTYAPGETEALAKRLRTEHAGEAVLVVGHSNTLPELLRHLGAKDPPAVAEDAYDDLFVVSVGAAGAATVRHLHLGP